MASTLRKLTGVGSDVRKIAALLQKKAPPGHKLAYINDEEAALLKSRGGSGKPHADTGIPSFELDDSFALQGDTSGGPSEVAPTQETYGGDTYAAPAISDVGSFSSVAPVSVSPQVAGGGIPSVSAATEAPTYDQYTSGVGQGRLEAIRDAEIAGLAPTTAAPPIKPEAPTTLGMKDETLARLGLAGGLGLLGASTARKAAASGQVGAQQIQGLATPYQKQGAELQAQAQRGELTPAAQQSLQAVQAQAAQAAQARGGVGAAQTQQQVEAYRQQLLAQQYDYGLKLSGIGDNIALGAIKTGLEADRYVQQLNNSFYTNMAYVASGMSPGIRVGGNQ
jgi:hypothetical protein